MSNRYKNHGDNTMGLPVGSSPHNGVQCGSTRTPDQCRFHVLPESDLREHELHPNCWCTPKEVIIGWAGKGTGRTYVHNPLDGRSRTRNGV